MKHQTFSIETPVNILPYENVLGRELTVKFLLVLGGRPLYLPATQPRQDSAITKVLGREAAIALGKELGLGSIRVPLAKPYLATCLVDQGFSIMQISRLLHVSDVSVRRWVPEAFRTMAAERKKEAKDQEYKELETLAFEIRMAGE